MALLDQVLESLFEHVSIDLRRRDIGVAEHLLQRTQIHAVGQKMAGERMAQYMRRDTAWIDAGHCRQFL